MRATDNIETMKAVVIRRYGDPDVLASVERPVPAPKDNEILIRVRAAAATAAECAVRKGDPWVARLFMGIIKPKFPIPGVELAGDVEAVGKDVTRFSVGDAVTASSSKTFGAMAEYICLPEDGAAAPKPRNMSYEEAAGACEGLLTALPFLRDKASVRPGQSVLINGASGSVGSFAVQTAKNLGAEVTGVCSAKNADWVRELGADRVIDYTREDFTKNGIAYDVILDTVGNRSFAECKSALALNGIYLSTVFSAGILFQMFLTKARPGKKAVFHASGLRPDKDKQRDLMFLKEQSESGKLKPTVDRVYPLDRVREAYRYVETGHKRGSVLVTMTDE
jgi:NADPH:quinone reductase-like Zn-dependent oxidoreductase